MTQSWVADILARDGTTQPDYSKSSSSSSSSSLHKDFSWSETDEPHASRRKLILAKYPQIKELFVYEPKTFLVVVALVTFQFTLAYYLRNANQWLTFALAYIIGGIINHTLQLAVHDLSHNLCFKTPLFNKLTSIMANLCTGVPSGISFQRYHLDHHQFQGVDKIDMDVPSSFEVHFFTNSFLKLIWVFLQPFFYALRPVFLKPQMMNTWELINYVVQFTCNYLVVQYWGWQAFAYLLGGSLLGMGLHPAAGHFIAEHYQFIKGQETYSYYGIMNFFNLNVGYHNEHHDFPKVPWTKLPLVKKIAPEFYDNLPSYTSYLYVFYMYITDDNIGPFSRVKRSKTSGKGN